MVGRAERGVFWGTHGWWSGRRVCRERVCGQKGRFLLLLGRREAASQHTYTHVSMYLDAYMYIYVCVCIYIYTHIYIYIYTYICIYI